MFKPISVEQKNEPSCSDWLESYNQAMAYVLQERSSIHSYDLIIITYLYHAWKAGIDHAKVALHISNSLIFKEEQYK